MNAAYLHLLVNHVPVIGIPIALFVLVVGIVWKKDQFVRVALLLCVFCAVLTIPVYFSGEPAEHRIEHLPGVSHSKIDEHEESGEIGFAGVSVLAVLSLAGMIWFRRFPILPRWFVMTVLIVCLFVSAILTRTAHLGGLIRHPEMSNSQPSVPEPEE
jgi:hypothetical protein